MRDERDEREMRDEMMHAFAPNRCACLFSLPTALQIVLLLLLTENSPFFLFPLILFFLFL